MRRFSGLLVLSGLAFVAALLLPERGLSVFLLGVGGGCLAMALLAIWRAGVSGIFDIRERGSLFRALEGASETSLISDLTGARVRLASGRARLPFLGADPPTLEAVFARYVISPEETVARLAEAAVARAFAEAAFPAGDGTLMVRVLRARRNTLLWLIEEQEVGARPDTLPFPVLEVSASGTILAVNAAARAMFGRISQLPQELTAAGRDGEPVEIHTRSGAVKVVVLVSAKGGQREFTLVPANDGRMRQGDHGLLSEPGLLDALPVPMLKIAPDGAVLAANAESRAIFGLDSDDPLPPLFELVEGMGRPIVEWLNDASLGRGLLKPEIVRAVLPGKEVFLQISLGRAVEGDEVVLVGILNDATELKTLEAQFVQSQKMQAIGQLAGGVAHDFNNLLTAISGHCDLLLLRHDRSDTDHADLTQIAQNANRAASLVSQLLAFSRKQNLKPQPLDLRETMSDLAYLLNRLIGEKIALDVDLDPAIPRIRADKRQLEQVIVNLVVNARDAMPDGGKIRIASRPERLTAPLSRDRATVPEGDYVTVTVTDEGIGISTESISKIFEPFFTTKTLGEGTGLGLSTAYGIVKQTGGFIFVDSEVGAGTTFTLYLPASESSDPSPVPEKGAPTEKKAPASGDGVILLVEDEAPVRAFASRALRLRGYTVYEAENAEEALAILADSTLNVDVFVTDVVMPGMDGPTWVRQALRSRPDTRVIFVSGYAEEGRAEKQSRIPNSVFLAKPFSLDSLIDVVHQQLS